MSSHSGYSPGVHHNWLQSKLPVMKMHVWILNNVLTPEWSYANSLSLVHIFLGFHKMGFVSYIIKCKNEPRCCKFLEYWQKKILLGVSYLGHSDREVYFSLILYHKKEEHIGIAFTCILRSTMTTKMSVFLLETIIENLESFNFSV